MPEAEKKFTILLLIKSLFIRLGVIRGGMKLNFVGKLQELLKSENHNSRFKIYLVINLRLINLSSFTLYGRFTTQSYKYQI